MRFLLFLLLGGSVLLAQPGQSLSSLVQTAHPMPLRGNTAAAMEELGAALGDARVIVIGGNTAVAGDLAMRLRLTQYLKEKKGFGVLLLDAGLYEGDRARNEYMFGGLGRDVLASNLSYGLAAGLDPLITLMDIGSDRTTAFVQGGYLALDHRAAPELAVELREYLQKRVPERCTQEPFMVLNAALACLAPSAAPVQRLSSRLSLTGAVAAVARTEAPVSPAAVDTTALNAAIATLCGHLDVCDKLYPKQVFASDFYREALTGVQMLARGAVRGTAGFERAIAARHLAWLVEKRYPTEKIVIWADNAGAIRPSHDQSTLAGYQSFLTNLQPATLAKTRTLGMTGLALDGPCLENELKGFAGWIPVGGNPLVFASTALGSQTVAQWGKAYDLMLAGPREASTDVGGAAASEVVMKSVPIRVLLLDSLTRKPVPFGLLQVGTLSFVTQENGLCLMTIPLEFVDEIAVVRSTGYHYKDSYSILKNLWVPEDSLKDIPDTIYTTQAARLATTIEPAMILRNVAKKRGENFPNLALELRGTLRTGPVDSAANVVVAAILQRRRGLQPTNSWLGSRATGVQLLSVMGGTFDKPAATRADDALAEVLQADVVSSAIGPLGAFSQAGFTFALDGSFAWDKQTFCHKLTYTCVRPGIEVVGLPGVTACTGVLWVEDRSFAVLRSEMKLTFADGHNLTRTAVYANRPKDGWAPVFLQAKHVSAKGDIRLDEWYTRSRTNAVTKPVYGSFASAQAPLANSPEFWQNFWQYCWSK